MAKSEFERYHEDEVLKVPTNRINTAPGSQTEKLMRVFDQYLYNDIQDTESMKRATALDNMIGGQLDDYGDDWDLPRLGESDDVYRFMLKLRSTNRTSQGTFNEFIRIVSAAFNMDPHDFQVQNDYIIHEDGTTEGMPFSVSVTNIPFDDVKHPEIIETFIKELANALLLGITLSDVGFVQQLKFNLYLAAVVQHHMVDNFGMNALFSSEQDVQASIPVGIGIATDNTDSFGMRGGN